MHYCNELPLILKWAYVPEHLPDYFCSFSDAKHYLDDDITYYCQPNGVSIIGYPLCPDFSVPGIESHVVGIAQRLKPGSIKTISPVQLNIPGYRCKNFEKDFYSCLELGKVFKNAKLRNMLKRASRDVYVSRTDAFTREHLLLLSGFIRSRGFDRDKTTFFHRLPDYLARCDRSMIIEARFLSDHSLAGFNVFDTGPGDYGFYLFNINTDRPRSFPGLNDLLLDLAISEIKALDKKYINMGLGVSSGIEGFKAKWGAVRFLPYYFQYFESAFSWKSFFIRG
jgi:hypothetical protein